jgi:hypothetical protein
MRHKAAEHFNIHTARRAHIEVGEERAKSISAELHPGLAQPVDERNPIDAVHAIQVVAPQVVMDRAHRHARPHCF